MTLRKWGLGAIAALLVAGGVGYAMLDPETRGILAHLPTNADVLQWPRSTRDAAFRAMDRLPFLAQAHWIPASTHPLPLPAGRPLVVPDIDAYMAGQHAAGLVILVDGKVRLERYAQGFGPTGRWTSFSVAKSFTSTLVGAALADGAIKSLDDKVSQYVPDLRGSAYDDVSIRQLLTMSSGVRWNEDYEDPKSDVSLFNKAVPDAGVDATVSYMRKLPRAHPPGTVWHYSTGETNLVGVLIASAVHKPLSQYLSEKIWQPAGMEGEASWLLSKTGVEIAGCCIQARTRDYARMGLYVLNDARANGRSIVPAGWFADATRKHQDIGEPGRGYGYQWWTFDDGSFAARGIFGQSIFIDPKRHLVIAENADYARADLTPEDDQRSAFEHKVQALLDAGQ